MEHRREAALEAFKSGKDAAGVQCPNCGNYRMHAVRVDADGNLLAAFAFLIVGIVALALVVFGGDIGLYVADASTIAVVFIIVGAVLYAIAHRRRRPSAFECYSCGYRVP